jgi:hypothetical protein
MDGERKRGLVNVTGPRFLSCFHFHSANPLLDSCGEAEFYSASRIHLFRLAFLHF